MKNILKLMLSVCSVIALAGSAFAFPDVAEDHWAAKQIQELHERGIVVGYPDGTFQPDENVTRAEYASMVIRALGQQEINVAQPVNFTDITSDFWAYDVIQKALYFDLLSYEEEGDLFRPDDSVSRAESITMAVNALTTQEITIDKASKALDGYADKAEVPPSFTMAAGKAAIINLLITTPNEKGKFIEATRPATRAEISAILYRMIEEARLNPNAKLAEVMRKKTGEGFVIDNATVHGSIGIIPAGSIFPIKLTKAISSQVNESGDIFNAVVPMNYVTKDNYILIYKGSNLRGQLLDVRKGKWFVRNGVLVLDNTLIVTPNDQVAKFHAEGEITKNRNWFMKIVRALLKGETLENLPENEVEVKLLKPVMIDLTNGWIIER